MNSRGMAADRHIPVLRDRIVELLAPALTEPGAVYLDGTLGMGGHAEAILESCPQARVVGIDRDREALALAAERLDRFAGRTTFVHAVYDEVPRALAEAGVTHVDASLYDLGVSSLQLDETDRGFSYSQDAPLDMRMDQSTGITAAEVLNTYSAADLEGILREFGEERFARKVAGAIVRERETEPFTTSGRLVDLLKKAVPAASQKSGGHPGKRTFQALRIEVNAELSVWTRALPRVIDALGVGGRVAVLSYHSLEDRITKRVLAQGAKGSSPEGLPVELPEHAAYLRLLTRGAEEAPADEQAANPRSASVRLRAAERTRLSTATKGTHR
ncbi:16S rRNA (cytosine(1402)-N(4))-methyltransferase RsmH [Phycicoccus sp. Root101]|uniref:16S rRNA (cytosine(1402)-N(4))-methyltransferase RsmH n=1 Tax=Phycicoccus sp. Root101 TaxID=1736421 RepID=UPI00070396CA|nr:16S rRNA (cytosine(1402)-N(4))-methyltransferase RsmH [Phycicoccus sp. Root101]KQU70417.1 ribosomal RNA small subunit methyltransferase H [Phycicoccus sp. Root101]